jgi:diguanylate cyclase (GGDEF)-like protein
MIRYQLGAKLPSFPSRHGRIEDAAKIRCAPKPSHHRPDRAYVEEQTNHLDVKPAAPRQWDDMPLPRKLTLLLMLTAVSGCMVGTLEARLGQRVWPAALGLTAVLIAVVTLAQHWVCQPYTKLMHQLDAVRLRRRIEALSKLPIDRRDEIGELARSVHEIGLIAIRNTADARQLRRTLDQRIAKATRQACGKLEQMVARDPLTDLANRRFMETQLHPLIEKLRQSDEDMVCMLIDMDNFKQVNDQLGHGAGDELLVFLAGLMRGLVRRNDDVVRLGGDEFAVFMPGCTVERAREVGEQLMQLFSQHTRTTLPRDLQCNLSVGIASLKQDVAQMSQAVDANGASSRAVDPTTEPGRALIECADRRLYQAKRAGKAQIAP